MARQLPSDSHKRRIARFRSIYQHMPHWYEQMVAGQMDEVITTPEGEDIYYWDLLVGLGDLPPRQREAFELICMRGYTETAAAKKMLPNSRWSTTVQQHVNAALERMVARYDEQQSGVRTFIKKVRALMALHPLIQDHLKDALKTAKSEIQAQISELRTASGQIDQMLKAETELRVTSRESEPAATANS